VMTSTFGDVSPAKTIPEVLDRLSSIQEHLHRTAPLGKHDGVACFNYLYRIITQDVWKRVQTADFQDLTFLNNLDVAFANRYLSALRAYERNPRSAPRSWAVLISRRSTSGISPLQFAIAGVNAHVDFDLAFALVTTSSGLRQPLAHGTQRADYQKVNAIFAKHMHALRTHFENQFERKFDDHFSRIANMLGDEIVVASRNVAWFNAAALYPWRANRHIHRLYHNALDGSTYALARMVLGRNPFGERGPTEPHRPPGGDGGTIVIP
jgi:hypothetical protein